MGKFTDLVARETAPKVESLPDAWNAQMPLLAEAFFPVPGKATGTFLTPRYSVTLFSEGVRLKAVLGSKTAPKKLWLTLDGPEAVLEQIEAALGKGSGEWRDSQEEK